MAKQDLVVKLLLDSGAFGNDLRQAERKAKEFGDKMKSAGDTAGNFTKEIGLSTGALGKLGSMLGAGGVVVAAVGAFKSIMESTSGTAVEFKSTIAGFQGVLDTFQTSLATFDFSNFSDGLLTVFRNAKNTRKAIEDMNFGDIAYKYLSGGYKTDLKKYKDEFISTETTVERKEELTSLVDETIKDWDTYLTNQKTNIINAFRAKMKDKDNDLDIGAISVELAEEWMREASKIMTDPDATKEWKKRVKGINKDINKNNRQSGWNGWLAGRGFISGDARADFNDAKDAADAAKKKLVEENQKDLFINEILEMNEKELTEAINQLDKINTLTQDYLNTKAEISGSVKTTTTTTTTKTTGGGGAQEVKAALGSIADLQKKIADAQNDANKAVVGTDAWWQAQENIKTYTEDLNAALLLQNKLLNPIEPLPKLPDILPKGLTAPELGLNYVKPNKSMSKIQELISKTSAKRDSLSVGSDEWIAATNALKEYNAEYARLVAIQEEYDGVKKEDKKEDWNEFNEVLGSTVFLFSSLSDAITATGDESSKELAAMMDIFSAIAEGALGVLPALEALTAAKTASSAASAPWPANIAAIISAVATVTSVFASITKITSAAKFADGGIVGGTSYSGDKLFAMVNSGEMILNKRQQGNLANMLGGGGQVEFHISGDSLVGVLNNKRNKTNLTR